MLRALQIALGLAAVGFTVSTLPGVRPEPGFVAWLDGWLQMVVYVVGAALVALRPALVPRARWFWSLLAASLTSRALAFSLYLFYVRHLDPAPYPSVADVFWLLSAALLMAALVVLARGTSARPTVGIMLDAVTGALVLAAAAAMFVYGPLLELLPPGTSTDVVTVNLAYPTFDVAIVTAFIGVLANARWRVRGPLLWIALGVVAHSVLDSLFVYQAVAGTFRPGTPLSALSVLGAAVLAGSAWVRPQLERREKPEAEPGPGIALPLAFGITGWALLVYAALTAVSTAAVALTAAAVVAALVRTGWSFYQSRALAEQRRLARTDEVTGLANRRALLETLEDSVRRPDGAGLGVLALDIDDFRALNEAVGHDHADTALEVVARRLRESTRAIDLVARLGADDFVVLLPGVTAQEAEEAADRFRASLRRPLEIAGSQRVIAASVGLAMFPADGRDADDLLRKAELALGDAQQNGLGQRRFDPERHKTAGDRQRQVGRLRTAIRGGELRMHYQPIIDLAAGRVVGVEALVRWDHPERGLLPPGDFLPLAESAGLMRELFGEVLRQSTHQTAQWHARGHDLGLALNVSVTDLLDPDLPDQIADALAVTGLRGTHLVLELTEEVFLAEPKRAADALARLWDHEVGLTIDDYGTGYSSLSYLRDLESLQGLKLDRGFVAGLDGDPRAQAIVASTLELAYSLDLEVVAEGIETSAVHRHLRALGCPLGQGYLFSRPVPADEVPLDATFPAGDEV
ncbi:MAG TPA: bifunctional diguanylate cyclase/phosphodiesterase [Egicoccus sp.]|nr:bifunctional diguanylate cyclase/phosphodiesterase [Egicoccus sp.]HSK24767.1 bifunctional diguanylate cyclase/phosphodiesterase [Egicoccus sp.]